MALKAVFRGWWGEARGALAQMLFLDRRVYTCINNVTVVTPTGAGTGTTQIDHIRLVLFSDEEVARMVATIRQWMLPRTAATRRMHVAGVAALFGSGTVCPKCGSALKLRTARTGKRAGSRFYGCSRYPVCRYARDVGEAADTGSM